MRNQGCPASCTMNCWPTMPVAPRMPTSTLLFDKATMNLLLGGFFGKKKPAGSGRRRVVEARFCCCFYVPSAHAPPTPQVPVTGTRFRVFVVVFAVCANMEDEYIGGRRNPSRSGGRARRVPEL